MTNVELCKEVADWAETTQNVGGALYFDMTDWIQSPALTGTLDDETDQEFPVPIEQLKEGSCGTAACVAGYVAILRAPKGTTTTGAKLYLPDGQETDCCAFAVKELDLTPGQRDALFYTSNESAIARLRYLAENPDATGAALAEIYVSER